MVLVKIFRGEPEKLRTGWWAETGNREARQASVKTTQRGRWRVDLVQGGGEEEELRPR